MNKILKFNAAFMKWRGMKQLYELNCLVDKKDIKKAKNWKLKDYYKSIK